jgi:hypothetical protein
MTREGLTMRQFVILKSDPKHTKLQDIDTEVIFTIPTFVAKQYPDNIIGLTW